MDPLELAALAAWCFAVALGGGLVGLVLGNIRLPAVLLVASSPAAGAGANIGISGVAALAAAAGHVRAGRVDWRLFAWMAPAVGTNLVVGVCVGAAGVVGHAPDGVDWELLAVGSAASVPGALIGSRLTGRLGEEHLLRAIGAMLVIAALAMAGQAAR